MIKIRDTFANANLTYRECYINSCHIEAITFIEDAEKFKIHMISGKEFRCDTEYLLHILESINN